MEEKKEDYCLLCQESLSFGETVRVLKRGLQTVIIASHIRDDGLWEILMDKDEEVVHRKCRVSYISRGNLHAVKDRKRKAVELEENKAIDPTTFNFRNLCFICGKSCIMESEHGEHTIIKTKYAVFRKYKVSDGCDLVEKVRAAADGIDDDLGKIVKTRLYEGIDLVEKGAVYHNLCILKFLKRLPKLQEEVDSAKKQREAKFAAVINEMEQSDKSQFLFDNLYEKMGDNAPDKNHFKSMLKKHFGDNIIISASRSEKKVVTLRNKLDKVLLQHYQSTIVRSSLEKRRDIVIQAANVIREDICKLYEQKGFSIDKLTIKFHKHFSANLQVFLNTVIHRSKKRNVQKENINDKNETPTINDNVNSLSKIQLQHKIIKPRIVDITNTIIRAVSPDAIIKNEDTLQQPGCSS